MDQSGFDLVSHGINVAAICRNLSPAMLYAEAIRDERDCAISDTGAFIAYSGARTGRSAKDRRIVKAPASEADIWCHSRQLADAPTATHPIFGVAVATECPDAAREVLSPRETWGDATAYDATARKLAGLLAATGTAG